MEQGKIAVKYLLHIVLGALFFLVIAAAAVGLDLLAKWIDTLNVDKFTSGAIAVTAHALLVIDLVLLFIHVVGSSIDLLKEMKK